MLSDGCVDGLEGFGMDSARALCCKRGSVLT